jgi:stage VI sporulation protein D
LSEENQTSLRFALSEVICFQKGQEVADLLSIELHPQVGVQEYSDYIQVKGALELYGEYYARPMEEGVSLRETEQTRTAQEVYEREDGIYVLTHLFPIDVSIPRNRIQEIDDIYVQIESFDYDLIEDGGLNIVADLSIVGLIEHAVEEAVTPSFIPFEEMEFTRFEEKSTNSEEMDMPLTFTRMEEGSTGVGEKKETEVDSTSNHYFEPFQFEMRKMPTAEELEEQMEQEKVGETEDIEKLLQPQVEYFSRQEASYEHTLDEIVEEMEEVKVEGAIGQEEEERDINLSRPENALYLTKLFQRGGGNEFKKMRMYFVQNGDTIESIADKYEIQVQQITRKNRLDDDFLYEGQLLYIPARPSRPKM